MASRICTVLRTGGRRSLSFYSPALNGCFGNSVNYSTSFFREVTQGPPDPILGVTVAFQNDPNPEKYLFGAGAYRDDNGQPFVLECVKEAKKRILEDPKLNHEYLPISGLPAFTKVAQELLFSPESKLLKEERVVTAQTLSGTGALRLGAAFLHRFLPKETAVYVPTPTWTNHFPILYDSGFESVHQYHYYDPNTCGLDFKKMSDDLMAAPERSVILLHVCAHNPTGVDPSMEQWRDLSKLVKEKDHLVFFDSAYQGFASGNPDRDAMPVRMFSDAGLQFIVAQSFAKNFGLYGERVGAFNVVAEDRDEAERIDSQLKILIRPMYSNPPAFGARIVATILNDAQLRKKWSEEVKLMADRIITMRQALVKNLTEAGSKRDWNHIIQQIGMFCFSGLTPEQVDKLREQHHIYMTRNGRISMAGVTSKNVSKLAQAMHEVTK